MVTYSEDVSLLEESIDITKGKEAQSDTKKDINPENKETIHMHVPTPDENKCVEHINT